MTRQTNHKVIKWPIRLAGGAFVMAGLLIAIGAAVFVSESSLSASTAADGLRLHQIDDSTAMLISAPLDAVASTSVTTADWRTTPNELANPPIELLHRRDYAGQRSSAAESVWLTGRVIPVDVH